MRIFFFYGLSVVLILFASGVFAQSTTGDSSASLNLMVTPSSPGFSILGVAPSDVDRPTTPTDFELSLLNASSNLSTIPRNYSLEFAPAWIFFGKKISYKSYESNNNVGNNIFQTLSISVATSTGDAETDTRMGLGFKFSICRGNIDQNFNDYHKKLTRGLAALDSVNSNFSNSLIMAIVADPLYRIYDDAVRHAATPQDALLASALVNHRTQEISDSILNKNKSIADSVKALKDLAGTIQLRRIGFKWDVAGATALDFVDMRIDNSYITHSGIWTTMGWETQNNFSFLGTARLLFQHANTVTLDTAKVNFDIGGRVIFDIKKFSFSLEALYRATTINSFSHSDYKYDLNIDYTFAANKAISFAVGKNFNDATPHYGSNLIAYLNLLLGLGSSRKIL